MSGRRRRSHAARHRNVDAAILLNRDAIGRESCASANREEFLGLVVW
jgi:hypothetical protein